MSNEEYFREAESEARKALCFRDKCGAIIVNQDVIIGRGYNAPPRDEIQNRKCENDYRESLKPKSDRTCCMHAEWRAILNAIATKGNIQGSILYFARLGQDGSLKYSGMPYCTVCSRLALDAGISKFGLWQKEGIILYEARIYNNLSYEFHINRY